MGIKKVATGIPGLDEMLGGGLPEARVILVAGGPGTGKTIFCSQFLYNGATKHDDKPVFISLDETKTHYFEEMLAFNWDFKKLEQENKFSFIEASDVKRIPEEAKVGRLHVGGKELGLVQLIDTTNTIIEKLGAKRVVLDSISGFVFRFPEAWERRLAVLEILEALASTGATCLVTGEALSLGDEKQVQPEEYASHGVILLQTIQTGQRIIRVQKMRGSKVDSAPRPYEIKENGIEVYSTQSIYT